jgi:hypothetical protein
MSLVAALLLLGGLALSPYRYFLLPLAGVAAMAFVRLREPAAGLLVLLPYVPLLNLEGLLPEPADGSSELYLSEVVLLTAFAIVGWRRPGALGLDGAGRLALAYGGWMTAAALVGAPTTDTARLARLVRTAFLAVAAFGLGRAAGQRPAGPRSWIDGATGAAGLFALLALAEAAFRLGPGVPRTGSPVGGSELLAIHLTLLTPPGLALVALGADRSWASRIILVLAGMALAISFSRSGWIGGWAAILGMGLLAGKFDPRRGRRLAAIAGILAAAAVAAAIGLHAAGGAAGDLGARVRSFADPLGFLHGREREWRQGLASIGAHPLFGDPDAPNPYNLVLGLAAVSGLPILIPLAGMVTAAVRNGMRARAVANTWAPAVGLLGALIALLVTGIGESSLGARVTPAAMVTLGLLTGLGSASQTRRPRP